jgi:hypothetical protein
MTPATKLFVFPVLSVAFACACETPVPDPPPPASPTDIPSAAPRALGALAAGTDAAPRPNPLPEGLAPPAEPDEGSVPEMGSGGQGSGQPGVETVPL